MIQTSVLVEALNEAGYRAINSFIDEGVNGILGVYPVNNSFNSVRNEAVQALSFRILAIKGKGKQENDDYCNEVRDFLYSKGCTFDQDWQLIGKLDSGYFQSSITGEYYNDIPEGPDYPTIIEELRGQIASLNLQIEEMQENFDTQLGDISLALDEFAGEEL